MQIKDVLQLKLPECWLPPGNELPINGCVSEAACCGGYRECLEHRSLIIFKFRSIFGWWKMGWRLLREWTKAVGCQVPGSGQLQDWP